MKLKRLDICGFKSFPEQTAIRFPSGISAIVGPNGCGKSNILDALRWVMGEQSPKQLRGKSMEDLIFSGTNNHHPARNMAEVSLTLLNDNGSAPEELKDYAEIMLTRRLYRSGETAYLLNKRPCRLKDIYNVLFGSGLGPRSYAVIQQGNIGAITEAGPEECRIFVEEAAGISRYRVKKKEARRKIRSTHQNLLRVKDILLEIERQAGSLKRQAKKAEKYKTLKKQLQIRDLQLGLVRYDRLSQTRSEILARIDALKDRELAVNTKLNRIETDVKAIEVDRRRKMDALTRNRDKRHAGQRRIDQMENDLSHADRDIQRLLTEIEELKSVSTRIDKHHGKLKNESTAAENKQRHIASSLVKADKEINTVKAAAGKVRERRHRINAELAEQKSYLLEQVAREAKINNIYQTATDQQGKLSGRIRGVNEEIRRAEVSVHDIEKEKEKILAQFESVKAKRAKLSSRISESFRQMAVLKEALAGQAEITRTTESDFHRAASNYLALKKIADSYQWYKEGVKTVLTASDKQSAFPASDIAGLVADILTPSPEYEIAVEAVLGDALEHLIVKNGENAVAAIAHLRKTQGGRAGFIPMDRLFQSKHPKDNASATNPRLLDHVSVRPGYEPVGAMLLDDVYVAKNLSDALELHHNNGGAATWVTRKGEVVLPDDRLLGGIRSKDGLLAKQRELVRLKTKKDQAAGVLAKHQAALGKQADRIDDAEHKHQELVARGRNEEREMVSVEKALLTVREKHKQAVRRLEIAELEKKQIRHESEELLEKVGSAHRRLTRVREEVAAARDFIAKNSDKNQAVSRDLAVFNDKLVRHQLKITRLTADQENALNNIDNIRRFLNDNQRRITETSEDIVRKQSKILEIEKDRQKLKKDLKTAYHELHDVTGRIRIVDAAIQTMESDLAEKEKKAAAFRLQRDQLLHRIQQVELEQSRLSANLESVSDRLRETYRHEIPDLKHMLENAADAGEKFPAEKMSEDEMAESVRRLKERVASMGNVHAGAIDEYNTLKERADFLTEQRDDLEKAIADLNHVIQKINKISKERFSATLNDINQKLGEVFPKLFNGGKAKLVMTEPDNILETGVEYMIHPPGKKLTRISLLSGGEKALSAIAFIFSIFLIKPASFCLLDEIDASLDDINVLRFNELLNMIGEKSQIVMVTHNKHTMEFADILLGVTMEQKGVSKLVSVNLAKSQ